MKIFVDIDGVLITKVGELAVGAEPFLRHIITHHQPYWLSTRTRDGTHVGAVRAFHSLLPEELVCRIFELPLDL